MENAIALRFAQGKDSSNNGPGEEGDKNIILPFLNCGRMEHNNIPVAYIRTEPAWD